MYLDTSRPTFDATKHFAALLHQQGRLPLDADLNEQALILLHQLRTMMIDLVGPTAIPKEHPGFQITAVNNNGKLDLTISAGRAYVDGILVENESNVDYTGQPDGYLDPDNPADAVPAKTPFAVYLRVWERLITALQDPTIREIALGDPGPDTAARAKTVWQVALLPLSAEGTAAQQLKEFTDAVKGFNANPGLLAARAKRPQDFDKDPCHTPPEAKYRGPENQLYRVEIHSGGPAWNPDAPTNKNNDPGGATFKWSRENGSVALPIQSLKGTKVFLGSLGRDGKLGLEVGDWVEISDDAAASRIADDRPLTQAHWARPLLQIASIDYEGRSVTLSDAVPDATGSQVALHPILRLWDHASSTSYDSTRRSVESDGALPVIEGEWITLEDGVQIQFTGPNQDGPAGTYRSGNYWTIPARTVTGDVEWSQGANGPQPEPPRGVHYHYALLGTLKPPNVTVANQPKTFKLT
ncbi:hypothetical protein A5784_21030 [Mycobacterium sp. 852013-50091_SCH5140682]|uniref:DUF6519 domain-containing protein n=1 Tax=Mycobacterium sp. 852013-50091_SCH5140682 TaxID=1834109 RepID=UPI0007EAF5FC|nr:DUF6519 domain-containing protein [Mycobacterium sp. 852013-50091_SCH5140682]OBC00024.1 hypothetical protein A5784_21030 [Mycobacterium sp. 852013-50091_SCH5140682]